MQLLAPSGGVQVPPSIGYTTGRFYDQSVNSNAAGARTVTANTIELSPFHVIIPLEIDQIGINVTTAVGGSNARVVVYGSNSGFFPDALIYESGSNLDTSTTGYKPSSQSLTFLPGIRYWVGFHTSAALGLRNANPNSVLSLGLSAGNATGYGTLIRRSLSFASPAPDPWVFSSAEIIQGLNPISIRMRAA